MTDLYDIAAGATLALHLAWILWVIFGFLVTRNRPVLRWLHLLSLAWGVTIEITRGPCPLTMAEQWLEAHAGIVPYSGPFIVHYLDAIVYPDLAPAVFTWGAVVVLLLNIAVYVSRFARAGAGAGSC